MNYLFTRKRDVRQRVNAERMFASYQKRLPPEHLCLFDRYLLSVTWLSKRSGLIMMQAGQGYGMMSYGTCPWAASEQVPAGHQLEQTA